VINLDIRAKDRIAIVFWWMVVLSLLFGEHLDWSKLKTIEWDAFGAVGGVGALGVALYLADSDRRSRARESRTRAALMSISIDHELAIVSAQCRFLYRESKRNTDTPVTVYPPLVAGGQPFVRNDALELVRDLLAMRDQFYTPLMDRFIDRAPDFDLDTAAHLNKAFTALSQIRRPPPKFESTEPSFMRNIASTIGRNAYLLRMDALRARRKLRPYRKLVLRRRSTLSPPL
jgi:hypothetical protein